MLTVEQRVFTLCVSFYNHPLKLTNIEQLPAICMAHRTGLEPVAFCVTGRRSLQLIQRCKISGEYFLHGFRPSVMLRLQTYLQDTNATILHAGWHTLARTRDQFLAPPLGIEPSFKD